MVRQFSTMRDIVKTQVQRRQPPPDQRPQIGTFADQQLPAGTKCFDIVWAFGSTCISYLLRRTLNTCKHVIQPAFLREQLRKHELFRPLGHPGGTCPPTSWACETSQTTVMCVPLDLPDHQHAVPNAPGEMPQVRSLQAILMGVMPETVPPQQRGGWRRGGRGEACENTLVTSKRASKRADENRPCEHMPKVNSPNKSPPLRSTVASLRSIAGHQRVGKNFGRMSLVTPAGDDDKDREDEVDTRNLDVSLMEKIAACPREGTVLRRVEDWISNLEYKYAGRCFRQCRQSPRRALSRCTKRTLWSSRQCAPVLLGNALPR